MDALTFVAGYLADEAKRVLRTGDSTTFNVGHTYVQTAGFGPGMVLIEIASNQFLPRKHHLSNAGMARLVEMGFTTPSKEFPNWWSRLENVDQDDPAITKAARTVVTALVDVYGIGLPQIAAAIKLDVYYPRPVPGRYTPPTERPVSRPPLITASASDWNNGSLSPNTTAWRQSEPAQSPPPPPRTSWTHW